MKVHYSPYNKTYKYICLQNQLAHQKNKQKVQSLGHSNISLASPTKNTKSSISSIKVMKQVATTSSIKKIPTQPQFTFLQPYRKIHKNASFDDRIRCQREKQNDRFAKRLCNSSCLITSMEETQKQYHHHLSYKQIVRRYDEENRRKNLIVLGNVSTLTHSNIKKYGDSKLQLCTLANSNKSKQKQSTYRQRYKNNYFVRSKGVKQPQRKVIKLF